MTTKLILRCLIVSLGFGVLAHTAAADVVHSVKFSAEKTIILWGEEASHATPTSISAMPATYTASQTQFAAPIVQAGVLEPIRDRIAPLNQRRNSGATFNVVSNTAYGIRAEISALPGSLQRSDLANLPFAFDLKSVGAKAAAPEANAYYARSLYLSDLQTPRTIFRSNKKTAARRGSPVDQSLEFEAQWGQLNSGGPIEISFTVFVP